MREEVKLYVEVLESESIKLNSNEHLYNPEPPCACAWCKDWVSEEDFFMIVGDTDKQIICESCLRSLERKLKTN